MKFTPTGYSQGKNARISHENNIRGKYARIFSTGYYQGERDVNVTLGRSLGEDARNFHVSSSGERKTNFHRGIFLDGNTRISHDNSIRGKYARIFSTGYYQGERDVNVTLGRSLGEDARNFHVSSSGERKTNFRRENGKMKMKSRKYWIFPGMILRGKIHKFPMKISYFPRDNPQGEDTQISHENIRFPPG